MPPEYHPKAGGDRVAAALNAAAGEWSRVGDRAELRRALLALFLDLDRQ
ncbi:MAG TPA: hypothetical protein VK509_08460 [Polyangiales bacterium]|nr:hypothetical protein [Polyangiales bacterium]